MKKLEILKLETLNGGADCSTVNGTSVGMTVGFIALGVLTGGVGFGVAAGLTAYFGTGAAIMCAMSPYTFK